MVGGKQGFFDLGPVARMPEPSGKSRGASSSRTGCEACGRAEGCENPKLPHWGQGKKKILVIIETPTARDDAQGRLLSGDSGAVLKEALEEVDLHLSDVWVVAAARCTGKDPTGAQIDQCRPHLMATIKELQPRVILALGSMAIHSILANRLSGRLAGVKPSSLVGFHFPDRENNAWVIGSFSLQFLVGADRRNDIKVLFHRHLELIPKLLRSPFPEVPDNVVCLTEVEAVNGYLREIMRVASWIAFDYETTGLKPHRQGHRIVSASVAWRRESGELIAISFPWFKDTGFLRLWKKLMTRESIGKVAHNNAFEATWTYWRAGEEGDNYWVKGWIGDTCLQAHCLRNQAPTSLKWEVFWRLGVIGYDAQVDPYLKSPEKDGANGFNRMGMIPVSLVLPYGGLDSAFSYYIHEKHLEELNDHQKVGAAFFVDAAAHLARTSSNGMHLDAEKIQKAYQDLSVEIDGLTRQIMDFPEAVAMGPGFNPWSDKQLAVCLYDRAGHPPGPNGRSVDEESIEAIGGPFVEALLSARKLKKLRDTYLDGFRVESVGGILRAVFNLQKVDTFRSSSSDPNFQNVPKRNKVAQKIVRSVFKPSPGNRIIEWDYKAVEVCISACYHKDPMMIKYIEDPTTDMHRDTAFGLFLRGPDDFTKEERTIAKNGFVFPSFYGSVGENMAHSIWVMLPQATKDHLRSKGIKSEAAFKKHVIEYEREFWEVRFKVYNEWRNRIWADYRKKGYIEMYTGFRMYGPLKKTQATNGQIQGTAFHCLLRTLAKAAPEIEAISGRSKIVGQIHDAMVGDIHPDDEAEADRIVQYYGTEEIRKAWPWIIVPLTIEKERSEIDGTWAVMSGCGHL